MSPIDPLDHLLSLHMPLTGADAPPPGLLDAEVSDAVESILGALRPVLPALVLSRWHRTQAAGVAAKHAAEVAHLERVHSEQVARLEGELQELKARARVEGEIPGLGTKLLKLQAGKVPRCSVATCSRQRGSGADAPHCVSHAAVRRSGFGRTLSELELRAYLELPDADRLMWRNRLKADRQRASDRAGQSSSPDPTKCDVPGCNARNHGRGVCSQHYGAGYRLGRIKKGGPTPLPAGVLSELARMDRERRQNGA